MGGGEKEREYELTPRVACASTQSLALPTKGELITADLCQNVSCCNQILARGDRPETISIIEVRNVSSRGKSFNKNIIYNNVQKEN